MSMFWSRIASVEIEDENISPQIDRGIVTKRPLQIVTSIQGVTIESALP